MMSSLVSATKPMATTPNTPPNKGEIMSDPYWYDMRTPEEREQEDNTTE